jgi:inosose dehydratase
MKIASAPCSYGVYGGATVGMRPADLLAAMAAAGYTGSELGPPGFFGGPEQTARAFADNGLAVVGGYVPLHLTLPDEVMAADLAGMRRTLEELQAGGDPGARAVLADEGDDALRAAPWRAPGERGMDRAAWRRAAERIAAACEVVRSYGVTPAFHPHYATYVEQPQEIDTLLELTDIGLCLDSGHFALGGADPARYAAEHAGRINHVHVKDVRHAVVTAAEAAADPDLESWWAGVSCPLGEGDVALLPFLAALRTGGYDGWFVIEQDRAPVTPETWRETAVHQLRNREWLAHAL